MLRCVILKYNFIQSNLSKYLLNVFNLELRAPCRRTFEALRGVQTNMFSKRVTETFDVFDLTRPIVEVRELWSSNFYQKFYRSCKCNLSLTSETTSKKVTLLARVGRYNNYLNVWQAFSILKNLQQRSPFEYKEIRTVITTKKSRFASEVKQVNYFISIKFVDK